MKVKIEAIVIVFQQGFPELLARKMPGATVSKLLQLRQKLEPFHKANEETRNKLIADHAKPGETSLSQGTPEVAAFIKDYQAALDEEVEVDAAPLALSEIGAADYTGNMILGMGPFLVG